MQIIVKKIAVHAFTRCRPLYVLLMAAAPVPYHTIPLRIESKWLLDYVIFFRIYKTLSKLDENLEMIDRRKC